MLCAVDDVLGTIEVRQRSPGQPGSALGEIVLERVEFPLALVRGLFAVVRPPVTQIRHVLALVGEGFPLVGFLVTASSQHFALGGELVTLVELVFTLVEPVFALLEPLDTFFRWPTGTCVLRGWLVCHSLTL